MMVRSSKDRSGLGLIALVAICLGLLHFPAPNSMAAAGVLPLLPRQDIEPANPNASADARKILSYLASLPGREDNRVISGQNLGYRATEVASGYNQLVEALKNSTGKYVGIVSAVFGRGDTQSDMDGACDSLIGYWREGHLVMVIHEPNNPWTGGDPDDLTGRNLGQLTDPGSSVYSNWIAELDRVAAALNKLQANGVAVIFVPFNEMNFRTQWWWDMGAVLDDHPDQAEAAWTGMWIHMYNYFTTAKGLNNLLWQYLPADVNSTSWNNPDRVYPGNNYVDIVGLSLYSDSQTIHGSPSGYSIMTGLGKPYGLTGVGPGERLDGTWDTYKIISSIKNSYSQTAFWVSWHSWTGNKVALVDNTNALALLNDPWVITRAELEWRDSTALFADVPPDHPHHIEIEALYRAGYTAGCNTDPLRYCPEATMNRAESSVFVERGIHTASYDPPAASSQVFADLALDSWAAKWVNGLWQDQYTAGCGTDPLVYCPWQGHTRAEGCVLYLRMLNGADFAPPTPTSQVFTDVPLDAWYAGWVHEAYAAGLLEPCQTTPELRFCPDDPLTRAVAAHMMVQAKGLLAP